MCFVVILHKINDRKMHTYEHYEEGKRENKPVASSECSVQSEENGISQ